MKELAIVVCNYNKKDYLLKCLETIFQQDFNDFDVYIVDNASTDHSVEAIIKTYKEHQEFTILENKENLGGSGGFNTGIRKALDMGYPYIMLVDNDITMDRSNVRSLMDFLKTHPDVGIVGSKIYKMDQADEIQDFGAAIDFENMQVRPYFANQKDQPDLPDVQYCDYVPACSLIVRSDDIRKIGSLPEDNFIYWDDMEWGWKYNLAGYKVAAIADAKVWHKGGSNISTNTFQAYYMYRNKIAFFAKYYPIEKKEFWIQKTLDEVFRASYACFYSGRINRAKTILDAFLDAIFQKRGKASSYMIRSADPNVNRLHTLLAGKTKIALICDEDTFYLPVKNRLDELGSFEIVMVKKGEFDKESYDIVFQVCSHIFDDIQEFDKEYPYIDSWGNLILTADDYKLSSNYKNMFSFFIMSYQDRLTKCFDEYREKTEKYE